jgi:hypothetical protein
MIQIPCRHNRFVKRHIKRFVTRLANALSIVSAPDGELLCHSAKRKILASASAGDNGRR